MTKTTSQRCFQTRFVDSTEPTSWLSVPRRWIRNHSKAHLQLFLARRSIKIKGVVLLTIAALVSACAGTPHDERYVDYGQIRGERVRIPPCNPFNADQLMAWATELDGGQYQERRARVNVDTGGFVTCSSSEAAGSHSRGR